MDAGPPRTTIRVPVATGIADSLRLTNEFTTPAGIGHPTNSGPCPLALNGVDSAGNLIDGQALELFPGRSVDHYNAPAGAVAILVAAFDCPGGFGELTFDMPIS